VHPDGLKPHTHAERMAAARALVPLFLRRFGDGLRAVALTGSVARGDDRPFSDLELVVVLRELPAGEDPYLQRIVDGMLVEAEYVTEASFLETRTAVGPAWYLAASEPLVPLHGAEVVEALVRRVRDVRHPREAFLSRAALRFWEVQESFGKALNAAGAGDRGALALLLWDAVHHALVTLAFLNEQPFTTFARFIPEARAFSRKPVRFDELLDRAAGNADPEGLPELLLEVFAGFEALFRAEGVALYDADLDPAEPNRRRG
jgi:predicted nucleotidyltransferase